MKASAEKSSSTASKPAAQTAASQPFFSKAGGGDFFAPAVQMKIAVNQPGDKFEQEADKTADKIMRMPAPAGKEDKLQRQPDEKLQKKEDDKIQKAAAPEEKPQKKEEEKIQKAAMPEEKVQKKDAEKLQKAPANDDKLQRKGGDKAPSIDANLQATIQNKTAGGQPLPADLRSFMETRFGANFSNVRIHNDGEAASLSSQLGAKAFTYQNHIFFARGQYQPGSSEGKQLLAHELTHTLQQGHAVRRKADAAPAKTASVKPSLTSSEVVDVSTSVFNPSPKVMEEIEAQGAKGLDVRVMVKGLAEEGTIKVRVDRAKNYDSVRMGSMPLINPWAQQMGGLYVNFTVKNSEISGGYASLKPGGGNTNDWLQALQKNAELLGGLGLKIEKLPKPVNKFENGKLTLGVTDLNVEVGGYVDAKFNITVENNNKPKIDASGDINIRGISKNKLQLSNTEGKLVGQISLAIDYKSFSGAALVKYNAEGTVDVDGKAGYNADKLSGEIHFVSTDLDAANSFAKNAISAAGGKENVQNAAAPAPAPAPKAGKKQRALAAAGQLGFNLTTWFAGTVNVVVDGKGAITVIGKIAPPAEIELFKQRDWDKELIKFEAKAYYGIPVVGNLNLFANISLHALAKLGPAKIYNIEILGTYSTDPDIQKNIQISGSINISAYAGLRLRAEGGAGIEIVSHDLKFGVGIQADVGVKAYADARPTIGYRDPGVFYISGTLEMVAQPMLGLGGDFFIALETPWWSPLSDDRWTWPLFSKEWPLTDPIGLSATVKDYVLGSGVAPEIELKKPEFNPSLLMTSMVDKTLPDKSGGAGSGQGTFKEDGSVPKPTIPPKKPEPKKVDAKPGKKGAPPKGGKSGAPDPKAAKDQANTKIFQNAAKLLAALKGRAPFARDGLNKELAVIKGQVSGIDFDVQLKGEKWGVTPKAGGKTGKGLELGAKVDKDNLEALPDIEVKTDLSMTGEGHTVTAIAHGGVLQIMMASALQKRLNDTLVGAIKEVNKPTSNIKATDRPIVTAELQKLQGDAKESKIQSEWKKLGAGKQRALPNTSAKVRFQQFLDIQLKPIVADLKGIAAKHNIHSLDEFFKKMPDERLLPDDYKVRQKLYERGSGWSSTRQSIHDVEKAKFITRVQDIFTETSEQKLKNRLQFMVRADQLPVDALNRYDQVKITKNPLQNFVKYVENTEYQVDHLIPLARHWESTGYRSGDDARWKKTVDTGNLHLITKAANLSKGGEGYFFTNQQFVSSQFTSMYAEGGIQGARTIDGKPFRDNTTKKPI